METIDEIELFTGKEYGSKTSTRVKQVPPDYSEDIGFLRILYDVVSTRYLELEKLEADPSKDNLIKYGYDDEGPLDKLFFKRFDKLTELTIDEKIKVEKYFWIRVLSDFYRDDNQRDKFQLQPRFYLRMLQDYMKKKFIDKSFSELQTEFDKEYDEQLESNETLQKKDLATVAQKMMAVNNFDLDTSFLYYLRNLYKFSIITVTRGNTASRLVRFPTLNTKVREGIAYNIDDALSDQNKDALIEWHTERSSDGKYMYEEEGINAYANSLLASAKDFVEEKFEFEKSMLDRTKYLLLYKKEVISIMDKSKYNFMVLKALCVRHMTRKFKDKIEALDNDGEQEFEDFIFLTLDKKKFEPAEEFRPGMTNQIYEWKMYDASILANVLGINEDEVDYSILRLESTNKRFGSGVRKKKLYQPLKY